MILLVCGATPQRDFWEELIRYITVIRITKHHYIRVSPHACYRHKQPVGVDISA